MVVRLFAAFVITLLERVAVTEAGERGVAARQEAERRFKTGQGNPSSALMDEFAREERVETERQEERKRHRLRLLEEAIRFDELVLDADAAIQKLRRMAEVAGRSGWQETGAYLSALSARARIF